MHVKVILPSLEMHIEKQIIWEKELEDHDEDSIYTYKFENQFDQITHVLPQKMCHFITNNTTSNLQLTRATKRDAIHI